MNPHPILRRDFLSSLSGGFTGLALTHLLARDAAGSFAKAELNGGIHHPAKVKRVIQLFMNGGVSPMDTWDYKPELTKLDGQKLGSKTKIEGATGMQGALMKSPFEFKQHGQSGKWISSLFPEQAKLVDEMAFLQAMTGRSNVHGQNAYLMNNGFLLPGFPCMGAWISYALGNISDNLPGFIVLPDARGLPYNGRGCFTAGFLPAVHQGTVIKTDSPQPIPDLFASDQFANASRSADGEGLALLNQLNRSHVAQHPGDSRLAARVAQMMAADVLILLSDIDGFYTADPRCDPGARHIPFLEALSPEHDAMATGSNAAAGVGSGGMITKLAPSKMLVCITLTMPVMWNMGTTHSVTFSGVPLPHRPLDMALCMMVPCVCMQPLGRPVVPLV